MSFDSWNSLINDQWFRDENAGQAIVLAADDEFFATIADLNSEKLAGCSMRPVDHFVSSVREAGPWKNWPSTSDSKPRTTAYLALAILAVTKMDRAPDSDRRGTTSFWAPFRSLYSDESDGSGGIPKELAQLWLPIWEGIEIWANETMDGKYGLLSFPSRGMFEGKDPQVNVLSLIHI